MAVLCSRCVAVVKKQIISYSSLRYLSVSGSRRNLDAEAHNSNGSEEKEENAKDTILKASLDFVHQHGWTTEALAAGAEQSGFPGVAHGMFPSGGVELVHYLYKANNERLAEQLKAEVQAGEENPELKKSTRAFTKDALETRLRMTIPYLDVWPQAMGLMALPQNMPTALNNLVQLTDDIWFYAGDRSTNMHWYSKRASLAVVYKTTELCMLQDKSEDFQDTWNFMNRRVEDFMAAGKCVQQVEQSSDVLREVLKNGSILVKNMLGASDMRR